jgi:hypothetical protein
MKHAVTLRLDLELLKAVRRCASQENRTLTNFVETVLKEHIAIARERPEMLAGQESARSAASTFPAAVRDDE